MGPRHGYPQHVIFNTAYTYKHKNTLFWVEKQETCVTAFGCLPATSHPQYHPEVVIIFGKRSFQMCLGSLLWAIKKIWCKINKWTHYFYTLTKKHLHWSNSSKKVVIVWWKLSVINESETQLCRFKWRQPVWQRPYATSDALSRDNTVIMMDTQALQTYSISVVFLMQHRAQPFLITSGRLSATFDDSGTWLAASVSL